MNNELLFRALQEYGVKETKGAEHTPRILQYLDWAGFNIYDDETAWCSTFMNAMANVLCLESSGKANARSWLNVGEVVPVGEQKPGDVVVFWRESKNSWKGHVGIYVNQKLTDIYVLGGNQNNMVCIKPYHAGRVLGYRRLRIKE